MNDAIGHGGSSSVLAGQAKRGLESWEVDVNIQQVPSAPFHLLFARLLNEFAVRHCCADNRVELRAAHLLTSRQLCATAFTNGAGG